MGQNFLFYYRRCCSNIVAVVDIFLINNSLKCLLYQCYFVMSHSSLSLSLSSSACVCVCVCMNMCERERECACDCVCDSLSLFQQFMVLQGECFVSKPIYIHS